MRQMSQDAKRRAAEVREENRRLEEELTARLKDENMTITREEAMVEAERIRREAIEAAGQAHDEMAAEALLTCSEAIVKLERVREKKSTTVRRACDKAMDKAEAIRQDARVKADGTYAKTMAQIELGWILDGVEEG